MMIGVSKFLKILNWTLLLLNCVLVVYHYFSLPEVIPTHFGLNGEADGFGNKKMIFFELIIAIGLSFLLHYMSENPNTPGLNIPEKLREDKDLTRFFVQGMLLFVMVLFLGISWTTIQVALGQQDGLGWFPLIILAFMFVYMITFFVWVQKK